MRSTETEVGDSRDGRFSARDGDLRTRVRTIIDATPVLDMHTHLFAPQFGSLNLWGIDELLTYHYLVAEFFRYSDIGPEAFWQLPKTRQADLIWDTLFVRHTPVSEATSGVVGVLTALGLDPRAQDLREMRAWFADQNFDDHLTKVLKLAGVSEVVMTNDPFDPVESSVWESGAPLDPRFRAALRLDPLLNSWPSACSFLREHGYNVRENFGSETLGEIRRFLDGWIDRMTPLYAAVSLPDDFCYPEESPRARLIRDAVLPCCRDHGLPFALMIGVRRQVNPALRLAGDGIGRADIQAVEHLCAEFPENRFLITMLSRENQHELCVAARKFRNLLPFGCWWFVNNPSMIMEITRERLELLGTSFIPQHSDARVLEQLVYKWRHSRRTIADALAESYLQLEANGRPVSNAEIERDVKSLFSGNFRAWTSGNAEVARIA